MTDTLTPETSTPHFCEGGCGTALPAHKHRGFVFGHKKNGCSGKPTIATIVAVRTEEDFNSDSEIRQFTCVLDEGQIERIWSLLPPPEKALGVIEALKAIRD